MPSLFPSLFYFSPSFVRTETVYGDCNTKNSELQVGTREKRKIFFRLPALRSPAQSDIHMQKNPYPPTHLQFSEQVRTLFQIAANQDKSNPSSGVKAQGCIPHPLM